MFQTGKEYLDAFSRFSSDPNLARRSLAKAITLVESTKPEDRKIAQEIVYTPKLCNNSHCETLLSSSNATLIRFGFQPI